MNAPSVPGTPTVSGPLTLSGPAAALLAPVPALAPVPTTRPAANAWLPTAPCTPAACLGPPRGPAAVPRGVLRLAALAALLAAGSALSPFARWLPAAPVRRWCRWTVRAAGVRVRITGSAPSGGGLLLVADHVSWLDIPLLAAVRPARMLAKSEIRRWPVAGWLAERGGALFIDRDRLRTLPATVAVIAGQLRAGGAVAVFPEGSTWCGGARGRFRRAAFQAALDAGAAVQPVRVRYRDGGAAPGTAAAFIGEDSLFASVWRVVTARRLIAEVEVCPVIPPGRHPDRRSLALAARPPDPEVPVGRHTPPGER
ncbi:lysophospholipid acyltransferase family protein [Streptomyces sp. SHP 1-2]|uniref:lysophospholipid acyltransferase family protein n=1 Tax=Streptomyces sp. SHP 1-2 TaxID=2769489 RepID=UPI0022370F27|nr:lysophospholipid acyltransferase family protein [Streptomyces sp. SHP 1-2]MCW5250295.1 1-acyl-sn-glycerol-3-phosphate acyltransferase [Streptomyces sp. SHP 1-2]